MQEFAIAPAGMKPLWVLIPVALLLAIVLTILAVSLVASRTAQFGVSAEAVRIRGDFYGRVIPIDQLRVDAARRVDLSQASELRPGVRTMGTGLPGSESGWFRLANGERALLYLTDRQKAVHIPTTLGYSLLLSPDDPDGFLAALRRVTR